MLLHGGGYVLREIKSGTGYVDISLALSRVLHVIELKVLRGRFEGVAQLLVYMKQEGRREGWLVVIDARPPNRRANFRTRLGRQLASCESLSSKLTRLLRAERDTKEGRRRDEGLTRASGRRRSARDAWRRVPSRPSMWK